MKEKALLLIITIISIFKITAEDIPQEILELQQSEQLLVDLIYDHKDFASELWNEIIKNRENRLENANKAIAALDYSLEIGNVLFQVQDQLIKYYSEENKNEDNLITARKNKQIAQGIILDIKKFRKEFIDLKTKILSM